MMERAEALHDVRDVEAFAVECVDRKFPALREDVREEMILEGITVLYEIAKRWDGRGRFSGYASATLPLRLIDAHRRRGGSYREFDAAGKRSWTHPEAPVSLEVAQASTFRSVAEVQAGIITEIGKALAAQVRDEHQATLRVAMLKAMGVSERDLATRLGMDPIEVKMALLRLRRIGESL